MSRAPRLDYPRLDYHRLCPAAFKAYLAFEHATEQACLEPGLLELVKLRASQQNGCAYCVDMHSKDARAQGEQEQRLYALPVWRRSSASASGPRWPGPRR